MPRFRNVTFLIKNKMTKSLKVLKIFFCLIFLFFSTNGCLADFEKKEKTKNTPPFKVAEKILSVELNIRNESYETSNMHVALGKFHYLPDYKIFRSNSFNGVVVSFSGNSLGFFALRDISPVICSDERKENGQMRGGCIKLSEGKITIQLPYFPNGKYADIYDPYGKKVLTIDLSSKATCNEDGKCDQPVEDSENCSQDCRAEEPKIDPRIIEQAETESHKQATAESGLATNFANLNRRTFLIVGGVILAFLFLGFWLWRRYKRVKNQINF